MPTVLPAVFSLKMHCLNTWGRIKWKKTIFFLNGTGA
jgi:hypothetical protein